MHSVSNATSRATCEFACCFFCVTGEQKKGALPHPRLDPVLHLAGAIVGGVGLLIAVKYSDRCTRIEPGKLVHKDGVFSSAVEEDDEHHGSEADCERDLVLVHGSWREPVKYALSCKTNSNQ